MKMEEGFVKIGRLNFHEISSTFSNAHENFLGDPEPPSLPHILDFTEHVVVLYGNKKIKI